MNNMKRGEYFIDRNAISTSNVIPKKNKKKRSEWDLWDEKGFFCVPATTPESKRLLINQARHQ